MDEIINKLNALKDKIQQLETSHNKMLKADLFHGNFNDYLGYILEKQREYLYYFLRKAPGESAEETRIGILQSLSVPEYHPMFLIQKIIRILFKGLNGICRENGLRYWLDGRTLSAVHKITDLAPGDDHANVGMPLDDIEKLTALLSGNPDYFVEISYTCTKKGYIKLYRFMLRKCNATFIDLFSYHYADFDSVLHKGEYWKKVDGLRRAYGEESCGLQELIEGNPALAEQREALVRKYMRQQDEIISKNNDKGALFWGIENFAYGRDNILNCEKMFPLGDIDLWGDKFCSANEYLVKMRNISRLSLPSLDMGRIHKMQEAEEIRLRQIIKEYSE